MTMLSKLSWLRFRTLALVASVAVVAFSGTASADPPSRVARLGYMDGAVSFSPAGENDWVQATLNRPLTTGDRLWADTGARAEVQIGGAVIRMGAVTGVSVLNLDDSVAQLQLTQGGLSVRVRRLEPNQVFEVDTPNLAFTLRQPGAFRIEVDPDGSATTIIVRQGQGEVYGEGAAYVVDSRQAYRFEGTGLYDYQYVDARRWDDFDRWASDRDRSYDTSVSARYVSPDVVGYQDLDAYGTWRVDASYGNVWFPNRVAAGWAPYRDGHWAWVDPWGWTWVDDAPWGFAVSHYGRWAYLGGSWGWVPGPVRTRAYYAPALVAFVGGLGFQITLSSGPIGGVAWFPLGPREIYQPSYPVSRSYFTNINQTNTVINTTIINNYYNNSNVTNVVYANRQVPGAVVAVPTTAFVQSQPVARAAVRVTQDVAVSTPVAAVAPVAPTERSVRGAAAQRDRPPSRVFERPVIARTAPPAAPVGFAAQQQRLAAQPGKPLAESARKELKAPASPASPAAASAPAPEVKVVAPARSTPPSARPPTAPPGGRANAARDRSREREGATAPGAPRTEGAPQAFAPTPSEPPQRVSPAPARQPPESRARPEQRGAGEQRAQPTAPPPTPPQGTARTPSAPALVAPPAPTAQPSESRGRPEGRPEPRGGTEPRGPMASPPLTAQPQESRGTPERGSPPDQRSAPVQRATPEQRSEPRRSVEQRERPSGPPPQRTTQAPGAASPQVASPPPAAQQPERRGRPEPAPAARPPEPRPQAAEAGAAPPAAAPKAEPRGGESAPRASKSKDKRKDGDEQKREDEARKQKEKG